MLTKLPTLAVLWIVLGHQQRVNKTYENNWIIDAENWIPSPIIPFHRGGEGGGISHLEKKFEQTLSN